MKVRCDKANECRQNGCYHKTSHNKQKECDFAEHCVRDVKCVDDEDKNEI
jgi:hypothetical protein